MLLVEGEIYCEVHGCVHAQTRNPYDYNIEDWGEPDCGPEDWRILWAGRYTTPEEE